MPQKRCSAGQHVYDTDKHTSCPFCTPEPTNSKETKKKDVIPHKQSGRTRVIISGGDGESPIDPVVGWLVVLNGKGKGRDLRISSGLSQIGSETGDIILDFNDDFISREKHARLAYDPLENSFFISCGESRNPTRLNGKLLMNTKVLMPFDRLRFGKTDLLFVPFCKDGFSWNQD